MGNPIREARALAFGGDFWAIGLLLCNVPCCLRNLRNALVGGFTTIKLTKEERKPFP